MQTAYHAANAVDAQMVCDVLRQEGVECHILGEHLQGAVGELPALSMVRVQVPDEHLDRARTLIAAWEAAAPSLGADKAAEAPAPERRSRKGALLVALFFGGLIGSIAAFFGMSGAGDSQGVDHNKDGKLDEQWFYSKTGTLTRTEVDRSFDGKVDYIATADRAGVLERGESDDDFNGVFETRMQFQFGSLSVVETDTDGDSFPDLVTGFEDGVLKQNAFISSKSGKPFRVEHFRLGRLIYAEIDRDGDGTLEGRVDFNAKGEPVDLPK